jgi:hypothetical protein
MPQLTINKRAPIVSSTGGKLQAWSAVLGFLMAPLFFRGFLFLAASARESLLLRPIVRTRFHFVVLTREAVEVKDFLRVLGHGTSSMPDISEPTTIKTALGSSQSIAAPLNCASGKYNCAHEKPSRIDFKCAGGFEGCFTNIAVPGCPSERMCGVFCGGNLVSKPLRLNSEISLAASHLDRSSSAFPVMNTAPLAVVARKQFSKLLNSSTVNVPLALASNNATSCSSIDCKCSDNANSASVPSCSPTTPTIANVTSSLLRAFHFSDSANSSDNQPNKNRAPNANVTKTEMSHAETVADFDNDRSVPIDPYALALVRRRDPCARLRRSRRSWPWFQ